ncbi:MAG: alpha/beta fold hydrolase [Woeseia sp.]|nr:alpha/beta fold hydrolase [Woeseia sp.]
MPSRPQPETLFIDGPAGRLEALLEAPAVVPSKGVALICHPHPQQGGTMQNKVAHTLARAFYRSGYAALRFNFRGVGKSAGEYDEARGELADALACVDYLQQRWPQAPFWLSGFSFGAAIAINAAIERRPHGLISIAPAVYRFANNLDKQPDCPWLIVHGDTDELVPIEETIQWVNDMEPGPELDVFEDTGHFFHGKLNELRETVTNFVANHDD